MLILPTEASANEQDQAEPFVTRFLDSVKLMYGNLRGVIDKEFSTNGKQAVSLG